MLHAQEPQARDLATPGPASQTSSLEKGLIQPPKAALPYLCPSPPDVERAVEIAEKALWVFPGTQFLA